MGQRLEELPVSLLLSARAAEGLPAGSPRDLVGESPAATGLSVEAPSEPVTVRLLDALLGSVHPAPFVLRALTRSVPKERSR